MSRERLARAVARPIPALLRQFGDAVEARRPEQTRAADGSLVHEWRLLPGQPGRFAALLARLNEADRRRTWGTEVEAEVQAYALLTVGLAVKDIVRPREGSFAGMAFEVVAVAPDDYGGLAELALKRVPPRPDYGF